MHWLMLVPMPMTLIRATTSLIRICSELWALVMSTSTLLLRATCIGEQQPLEIPMSTLLLLETFTIMLLPPLAAFTIVLLSLEIYIGEQLPPETSTNM